MPVVPDVSEHSRELSASDAASREQLRCVLYIGDDPQKGAAWCEALTGAGYSVTAVDSPAAGLSAYVERRFNAVFLAFHKPRVSSGLLATVMRLFRRGTPLILLSDSGRSSDEELAPFDRVFPMNTTPSVVIGCLHGLMERGETMSRRQILQFPAPRAGSSGRS